jgi:glycerol-3-phosphate dehydrogenase
VTRIRDDGSALVLTDADANLLARAEFVVNCAGLNADTLARAADAGAFKIYPRKGEFFVFEPPAWELLDVIRLPVPSAGTKGVLVFPTVDGKLVAGPTAHDQRDKRDWSVRPAALAEVMGKAAALVPELQGIAPVASYAGLRPAGRGVNYLIERSPVQPRMILAAAIRSTGLSACLGIAERVTELLADAGVELGEEEPLRPAPTRMPRQPWWRRSAEYWATVT